MPEIKTSPDHPASMAERIEKRLRPSNDTAHADVVKQVGHSPTRTVTSIHHAAGHVPPRDLRDTNIREAVNIPARGTKS